MPSGDFFALEICRNDKSSDFDLYVVVSTEGEKDWRVQPLPVTLPAPRPYVAFEMISPDVIWISDVIVSEAETQLYRSTDGGRSWTKISAISLNVSYPCLNFVDEQQGWAIDAAGGLFQTNDGGETWFAIKPILVS